MPDEAQADDLKNNTKASIVELLVKQAHEVTREPQKEDKNKT